MRLRIIKKEEIYDSLYNNLKDIGYSLDSSYKNKIKEYYELAKENKEMYSDILLNEKIAKEKRIPLCQDTGSVIVFAYVGQEVYLSFDLEEVINSVIEKIFIEEKYRLSIVDGRTRENTKTNTPVLINYKIIPGDKLLFKVMLKGAGSENQSTILTLPLDNNPDNIKNALINHMKKVGSKACPPYVIGISVGGTFEQAALKAKELLFNDLNQETEFERVLKDVVNDLNIGPMGTGGLTCVKVNLAYLPTHMASNFMAISICCSSVRKQVFEI